jgi:AraC family transcriptional regulator, transcriptional activator of pobA
MKNEIINFDGLYGDQILVDIKEYIHYEPLVFRSERNNWNIKPHFHQLLQQIFVIEKGTGTILFDNKEVLFNSPCILCIPENTQHGFIFEPETEGSVVTFSNSILDKIFINNDKLKWQFSTFRIVQAEKQPIKMAKLLTIIDQLKAEIEDSQPEKEQMLLAILTSFLTTIFRLAKLQYTASFTQKNRSLNIFNIFLKAIIQACNPQKMLIEYAAEQNISPLHLNRICKEVNQKTASNVVNSYFLNEAQKYLTYTNYSISEIAYKLNFNDAAYFSRLFKKEIGVSPKKFRSKIEKQ